MFPAPDWPKTKLCKSTKNGYGTPDPCKPEFILLTGTEDLAEGARADRIHCAGLQVDKDSPGYIFATGGLIIVDVDALKLEVGGAVVRAGGIDAVLVTDDLPELVLKYIKYIWRLR